MVINGRRERSRGRKKIRMLECEPQRPLAAHACSQQADGAGRQIPLLLKKRHDAFKHISLGAEYRIELRTEAISPPGPSPLRTDADQLLLIEPPRKAG